MSIERGRRDGARVYDRKPETGSFSLAVANRMFDKIVKEKQNHRDTPYTEVTDGRFMPTSARAWGSPVLAATEAPVAAPEPERERVACLLLTAIDAHQGAKLIANPRYAAQQKMDGKRITLYGDPDGVVAYNRTGIGCGIAPAIYRDAGTLGRSVGDYILDGEMIGDKYHVFDVLSLAGEDCRRTSFAARQNVLQTLFGLTSSLTSLVPCETAWTTDQKRAMLERLFASGAEGLVFRDIEAPHRTGRQSTEYKLKFWSSATFIVSEINPEGKNSVSIQLYNEGGELVNVGHVTVDYRKKGVGVGDLVELKYLYHNAGGSVYQVSFLNKRDDVLASECTLAQLRVKNATV